MITRRNFIKTSAVGATGLLGALNVPDVLALHNKRLPSELYSLSNDLLQEWATALLRLQITDKSSKDYGGIYCAADKAVHGRVGDTIYPFVYLADKKQDSKYLDSAELLYKWMENNVSQSDGSWLNEPVAGSWKGTTVFAAIALAEAVKNHGAIMGNDFKKAIIDRLYKAGNFVYDNFNIQYGNINYPVTAAYGLSLLGSLLDVTKFKQRGNELAHDSLKYFTRKDGLLYGEGDLSGQASPKGCFAIDLGYNVEESLPALVQYGLMNNDEEVLGTVVQSMQKHMEFMLPDGAWDNSWGTRNYKWTYWGSRTSDGCQTAYALLADRDPRFYKVALLNTQLLKKYTNDGLLQGGPHYAAHKVTPCVHHTFSHIKALTAVVAHGDHQQKWNVSKINLPREKVYGVRFFADIQTWLISKGRFRATVTGYDKEYKKTRNGHATGGALSMLWHEKAGPILCASMNEYQLYEAGNMQLDTDPLSMPLTPRIELKIDKLLYMNISDLNANVDVHDDGNTVTVNTKSKLVDKDQQNPQPGEINCETSYSFTGKKVVLKFRYDKTAYDEQVRIVLPVISRSTERIVVVSDKIIHIYRDNCVIKISSNNTIKQLPTAGGRVFNYVPGFEAVPLTIEGNDAVVEIEVV